jgi:transposase-like protein
MASKDPFNFLNSPVVVPIPCIDCGNNMHCVRRVPEQNGERQMFICAACGDTTERAVGIQASDYEIQKAAEASSGLFVA